MANYMIQRDLCHLPLQKKYTLWELPSCKKYRSHFEIIVSILDATKDRSEARYSLMKQTGINYSQLKKYLGSLSEIGLVETNTKEGQVLYRASERGLFFLRQYHVLGQMLVAAR